MQKVVGSSPIIRFTKPAADGGFSMPRHEQRQGQQPDSQLLVSFRRPACDSLGGGA
jgi:hypothetical protein